MNTPTNEQLDAAIEYVASLHEPHWLEQKDINAINIIITALAEARKDSVRMDKLQSFIDDEAARNPDGGGMKFYMFIPHGKTFREAIDTATKQDKS